MSTRIISARIMSIRIKFARLWSLKFCLAACFLAASFCMSAAASSCMVAASSLQNREQLKSPAEFLGYEPGKRFTPHHRILSYAEHVAEHSDRATLRHYGKTYEGRELVYLVLTTPGNQEHIREIRLNNLKISGFEDGEPSGRQKAILWLSYNVHGNEPSSSEAAMLTLHELADPANTETGAWLENSVVIIDPMLNPDGRERYVNWYSQMEGVEFNPLPDAREHHEGWPGGRSNHYYFDLNRDWAWQTQTETARRVEIYQQWMPHVHVDFHEQYHTDPYYFAPAAEPFHEAITDWQREFQTAIGLNHTSYFDEKGWLYFTRELFDLFYPSYGDTWPTFNGAVGMTYEQAGHSMAGRGITLPNGEILTLEDRLERHHVTGMSTAEIVSREADRIISEFQDHFDRAVNDPEGDYLTYVVKGDNPPDRIYALLTYLDRQNIRYGAAGSSRNTDGYHYQSGQTENIRVERGDIIISAFQPHSQLVRVLFEPQPVLSDSLTYDITAWEAHYRFGLEGYAIESRIEAEEQISPDQFRNPGQTGRQENAYAYLVNWQSMDDARFLADLLKEDIRIRFSMVPFTIDGYEYMRGSLIITRAGNRSVENFDEIVVRTARSHERHLHGTETGFVEAGSDFGSANVRLMETPETAVLMGEGTSSASAGEVWHFFDRQLGYPLTVIDTGHLQQAGLDRFDVLILPSGDYEGILDVAGIHRLKEWTEAGGRLVAIGAANSRLLGKEGFTLTAVEESTEAPERPGTLLQVFGDRAREAVQNTNPGSIYRISMDHTHPLAFGYGDDYYSLKVEADGYGYLESGWNVGIAGPNAHLSGFTGHKAKTRLEETLAFGEQEMGEGRVIYLIDNPLFRGFWENGKLLFTNAVFFTGQ